jgi:hypothetical protein
MGFFGHIPATDLKARYNRVSKQLILFASGDAVSYTSAISFERVQMLNGLKFALNGWVGPITDAKQPYDYNQSFSIELPNLQIFPTNTVIFVTSNYPEGKVVDIDYFFGEPLPADAATTTNGTTTESPLDKPLPDDFKPRIDIPTNPDGTAVGLGTTNKSLTKLFKIPFPITTSSKVPGPLGNITINFDKTHLQLTDSSLAANELTWTFNSLETGHTQIIVRTLGGGGTEIDNKTIYDVCVELPHGVGPVKPPIVPQNGTTKPATTQAAITEPSGAKDPHPVDDLIHPRIPIPLPWLTFANIGTKLLEAAYPLGVQLLEIQAVPLVPGPVTGPFQLAQMKIVARVAVEKASDNDVSHYTAILTSIGWGEFGSIEISVEPWLGDVVIEWPIKLDLLEAFGLMQAAGFTDPIEAMTLRQPLYSGLKEPYYIFSFPDGKFVAVGVEDSKVVPFGRGNLGFDTVETGSI